MNKELIEVLRKHAETYPLMQPQDVVKLIYQNEFGVGHIIQNKEKAKEYLLAELTTIKKQANDFCEIGNGMIRLSLSEISESEVEEVIQRMMKTTQQVFGYQENLIEKLQLVKELVNEGIFSFSIVEWNTYLANYIELGYPLVSHSQLYHEAYNPHYRVVLK